MRRFPFPRKNISIIIYGCENCPFCLEAKKYLDNLGKKYVYYDLDKIVKFKLAKSKKEVLEKLKDKIGNYHYIPIIFLKGEFIGGFNELKKEIK